LKGDGSLFSSLFLNEPLATSIYHFKLQACCVSDEPPRAERWEYLLEMGMTRIEEIMNGTGELPEKLTLIFPERWMAQWERRLLLDRINKHPSKTVKEVSLVTSDPLILGCIPNGCLTVIRNEELRTDV
jgi:hypothetical protein